MRPLGIFGGTFDPIHYGHVRTAFEMLEALRFAEVRFVPCGDPPHRGSTFASASDRLLMVREAIQGLNERQRMALLLSKFEDMSYLEIAETMGMSTQAVKSLLSRARSKLRDILEPYVQSGQLPAGVTDVMQQD